MRSILALGLAALILVAHTPGLFTETPVCAAVDGTTAQLAKARPGSMWRKAKPRTPSPSCCGTDACPMHAHGCGQTAACAMDAAYGPDPMFASADKGETRLCAPSCSREGPRVAPGVQDPGTIDPPSRGEPILAGTGCSHFAPGEPPTQNPTPAVPPPRS